MVESKQARRTATYQTSKQNDTGLSYPQNPGNKEVTGMCEYVNRHDVVTYALDAEELYNMLEQYIINVAWVPKIEQLSDDGMGK